MEKEKGVFREDDIRPRKWVKGQQKAIKNDIAWLLEKRRDFVSVVCPACASEDANEKFEKNGFSYLECNVCESFYMTPRPTFEILSEFLKRSENYKYWRKYIFPASQEARKQKIFVPRVNQVLDLCKRYTVNTSTLLEVGAGFGFFCEELNKRSIFKRVIGVEPNPELAKVCREKGIEIIEKPIEEIPLAQEQLFDVVVNFEVIEHLFSPKDFLQQCKKFLKPGGLFIVTCPNGKGFDFALLGKDCTNVDHEHINYFNPKSLALLLEECGFEVLESITPGQLDAELVRSKIQEGILDVSDRPFLKRVLIDEWGQLGGLFQQFIQDAGLSSNMWLAARSR